MKLKLKTAVLHFKAKAILYFKTLLILCPTFTIRIWYWENTTIKYSWKHWGPTNNKYKIHHIQLWVYTCYVENPLLMLAKSVPCRQTNEGYAIDLHHIHKYQRMFSIFYDFIDDFIFLLNRVMLINDGLACVCDKIETIAFDAYKSCLLIVCSVDGWVTKQL